VTAVVVTMAGESRRFREAGYAVPKYRLRVRGRTLFHWAMDSLRWYVEDGARLVLVGRRDDAGLADFARRECAQSGLGRPTVVQLDGVTSGQAETVLAAAEHVDDRERLVIYNIDTHVRPGVLGPATVRADGCIPCFPGQGDGWSFVAADAAGRVTAVAEKERISPHASVGLYAFRDLATYRAAYDATPLSTAGGGRGERYVAPLYTTLIEQGHDIRLVTIDAADVVALGTPDEARRVGPIAV